MAGERAAGTATKWTARLGLAALTLIAGTASYLHALAVVQVADGRHAVAYCIPALADLLIATAAANILDALHSGEGWPPLSTVAVVLGVAVTLGMNVASGDPHAVPSWLVNAWPPVAFLLGLESLIGQIRRSPGTTPPAAPQTVAVPATCSHPWPPEPLTADAALTALLASTSQRQLADLLNVPRTRVQAWAAQVADGGSEDSPAGGPEPVPPPALAGDTPPAPSPRGGQAALNGHGGAHA